MASLAAHPQLSRISLREFLGGLQVSVPGSKLAKGKTAFQLTSLGALILGRRRQRPAMHVAARVLRHAGGQLDPPPRLHQPVGRRDPDLHDRLGLRVGLKHIR
jgi:hypothetical protein